MYAISNNKTFLSCVLIALMGTLLLGACQQQKDQPEQVAQEFLDYIEEGELKKAKEISTKDTKKLLKLFDHTNFSDSIRNSDMTFRDLECEVQTDSATCRYERYFKGKSEGMETINLVRKEGKWLVNIEKEGLNKQERKSSWGWLMSF